MVPVAVTPKKCSRCGCDATAVGYKELANKRPSAIMMAGLTKRPIEPEIVCIPCANDEAKSKSSSA